MLLDVDGKLVGMNTAIYSPTGTSAGIGFAIPVDTLSAQVDTIVRTGRATRAILGISVLDGVQARALGLPQGVLVLKVPPDSDAARAGLRGSERAPDGAVVIGDVIIECDGKPVASEADLFKALDTHAPGDKVRVKVLRGVGPPTNGDAGGLLPGERKGGGGGGGSLGGGTTEPTTATLSVTLSSTEVNYSF